MRQRVREVYRPCCFVSVLKNTMVCSCRIKGCILESSDYFSSVDSPKEVSSWGVAFSKCLGKRKERGRENGSLV